MRPNARRPDRESAETLALQGLSFLLSDPSRLQRFMSLTGLDAADVRSAAETAELQVATLEYLLSDESLLLMFCQQEGLDPARVAPALDALIGRQR
jgi:hypothetical protein